MHQDVIGENKGGNIDHINHDTLDNRRENLRPCTVSQNGANQGVRVNNTSGFKGVSLFKRDQVWQAYINMFGKRRHLGYYATPIEAALAYDRAALEYHGEFAMTNKAMGLLP